MVGGEEEPAVQWGTKVEMAVAVRQRQQHHLPLRLEVPTGLLS